jgi:FAD/FMN-containing dehydrogenase
MVSKSKIDELGHRLRGPLLRPDSPGYDEARSVWNGRIDRRPALIVRSAGVADAVAAIRFAREEGLLLSVRGGGHDYGGNGVCDGGLVIDLGSMNGVRVDPDERIARVEPGATWGEFDGEAQAFGLATPGGTCSKAGVAGVTLGGGNGYLSRRFGLTIDNLVAADVVAADGRLVHASERENPDLFWALRGGGGNFGVVTSFAFRLHPVGPEVLGAQILLPFGQAREALRLYREVMAGAPDELQCFAFVFRLPPAAPYPEGNQGELAVGFGACFSGTISDGEAALRPLRECGDPILEAVQAMPFTALQKGFDDALPAGRRYVSRAHELGELSDEAIDAFLNGCRGFAGAHTLAYFGAGGGAVSRIDPGATAYPHRGSPFSFHLLAGWTEPSEDASITAWTDEFHRAMARFSTGGVYVNLLDGSDAARVRAAYGANWDRLARIKREWDPENLFRMNQNIPPAADAV